MNRSRPLSRTRFASLALSRPSFASLALLGALSLGSACKSDDPAKPDAKQKPAEKAEPPKPDRPVVPTGPVANPVDSPAIAEVGEVVATVQIPSGTAMTDVAAVIDTLQPGASMMLKMQLPAALESAAGFDLGKSARLDAPLSFVILDPSSHPQPLALLIEAKDADALTTAAKAEGHEVEQQGDLLLIGPAGVVAAAKEFAFANLTKYPDHTEIIVYPKKLLASYAGVMEQSIGSMTALLGEQGGESMARMLGAYVKGVVGIGEQTQRVVISMTASPGQAELIARFYPVPGSTLAGFVEAQVAADHALLTKLPAVGGTMLMSGDLRAGPARDAFVKFATEIMGPAYGGMPAEEWEKLITPWLDNLDGRYAMTMSMTVSPTPAMQMYTLMGVSDSAAIWTAWREMLAKMASGPGFEMMGMKITAKHEPKAIDHDGVEIDLYSSTIDTSAMPPEQAAAMQAGAASTSQSMHLAAFDEYAAMASADPEGKGIRSVIDAARGKGDNLAISAGMTTALDASKQRGDSMLIYFDFTEMMASMPTPPPQVPFKAMSMTVGKQDGALATRVTLIK